MLSESKHKFKVDKHEFRHGSFYLRVGAIAFCIGSMVYSGLEIGQYFELKGNRFFLLLHFAHTTSSASAPHITLSLLPEPLSTSATVAAAST